ncbi:MAG: hypothetical protein ABJO36_14320 [Litorimonas sp.]
MRVVGCEDETQPEYERKKSEVSHGLTHPHVPPTSKAMASSSTLPGRPVPTSVSTPSLLPGFTRERAALEKTLSVRGENALSSAQTVSAIRSALDRTGAAFARTTEDPALQKAGLWLIEVIKSGAGVLDRAVTADIAYVETGTPSAGVSGILGKPTLFYGAAGLLAVVGLIQGTGLVILSAAVLAGLHTLEPKRWKKLMALLPRTKPPAALEDHRGRQFTAEARLTVDAAGLIGQIEDALKTADHILSRLAEPPTETHWADTPRLAAMLQNLLEAGGAGDSDFALELIEKELPSLLRSSGISVISYSKKTSNYFDELPGIGDGPKVEMAAPALLREDGSLLRRGTIWVRS